jgi:ActR/RegA family two-component response regulator
MSPRLLIADSDTKMLDRCRPYFLNRGYEVELAANALECLEVVQCTRPEIFVLELELSWGGGDGVLAWLRDAPECWPETVVLTSSDVAAARQALQIGAPAGAVLRRPYSVLTLLETLRREHDCETHLASRFLAQARNIPSWNIHNLRRDRHPHRGPHEMGR